MNLIKPILNSLASIAAGVALVVTVPAWAQEQSPETVTEVSSLSNIPVPNLGARAWLTLDATSGQIIAAQNPDQFVEPASLTKIMSAYLVFEALESGSLKLDDKVRISERAWKTEGSRMFVNPNTEVSVDELLQGVIVQSGNDATVALAEAVAGSEDAFAELMNQKAQKLGMKNTHYTNSSGLPDDGHTTTVVDLAILARALVQDFPQYMHYYSQKEFTYNDIKQSNRNRLLWADETVDGLKTGHTKSAGYCLVTTALRDGRRVVSVLVGAASDAARTESSLNLLNWSFKNFDTVKLLDKGQAAVSPRVWEGESETAQLGLEQPLWVTVPRGMADDINTQASYSQPLLAPLTAGEESGTLTISVDGKVLKQENLVVLDDVEQAGFFGRMFDQIRLMFE